MSVKGERGGGKRGGTRYWDIIRANADHEKCVELFPDQDNENQDGNCETIDSSCNACSVRAGQLEFASAGLHLAGAGSRPAKQKCG